MKHMKKVWHLAVIAALLVGCVGCDQISKGVARSQLALGESHAFLGDTFRLVHVENAGAFLGMGANLPESVRTAVFQGAISVLIVGLLWVAVFRVGDRRWQAVGFTLLAASGIGNLIDRLMNDGLVTDFLNIGIGNFRSGIFNIADVVGVAGFLVLLLANGAGTPSNNSLERTSD